MTPRHHPRGESLGAYALGILTSEEEAKVREHTSSCEVCRIDLADLRETEAALGGVPPEAFLDGPPEDGGLLLRRTLRQVREERGVEARRRSLTVGLGAAACAAVLVLGGYLVGGAREHAQHVAGPAASSGPAVGTPGARVASATDPHTEARLHVRVTPAAGWVRVRAHVTGLPPGAHCRLVVLARDGRRQIAGSWVVNPATGGETGGRGTILDGSAAIAPEQVEAVEVVAESGERFVTVPL